MSQADVLAEESETVKLRREAKRELDALVERDELTPENVVERARSKASALHRYFDWDDTSAAASYRIIQARNIIRSVRIEIVRSEVTIRAPKFVRDPEREPEVAGYVELRGLRSAGARASVRYELSAIVGRMTRAIEIAEASKLDASTLRKLRDGVEKAIEDY